MPVGGPPPPPPPPPGTERIKMYTRSRGLLANVYRNERRAAFARTREIRGSHLLEIFDELLPRDGIRFVVSLLQNFGGILPFFGIERI